MKNRNLIFALLCSLTTFSANVFSADPVVDCPQDYQQQTVDAANAALADAKQRNNDLNQALNAVDKQAQSQTTSCMSALNNLGITGSMGLPNLGSIMAQIANGLDSACASAVNNAGSMVNSQVQQMAGNTKFAGIPGIPGTNYTPSIYVGGTGGSGFNLMKTATNATSSVFQTTSPPTAAPVSAPAAPQQSWVSRAVSTVKNAF